MILDWRIDEQHDGLKHRQIYNSVRTYVCFIAAVATSSNYSMVRATASEWI